MSDPGLNEFVLERVFAAPVATVWKAWTEPELFARWYKPMPQCETAVLEHDLRPGGVLRYEMRFGGPSAHYERWEFEAIEPPGLLRWRQMLTDADGNVIGNPRMPDWPRVMLTTIELEPHADGTLQRLRWIPFEATGAELEAFRSASPQLGRGWGSGFEILGALLEELAGR